MPDMVEEWKCREVPVWSHARIICAGETYENIVKMTFARRTSLETLQASSNASLADEVRL